MYNRINVIQSGNWSDPNTWFGGVFPSENDIVYCNGNILSIDVNVKVKAITNTQTYFDLNVLGHVVVVDDNITIESDLYCAGEKLITFSGNNLKIIGNIEGSKTSGYINTIENIGTGTIEVSGTITGGEGGFSYAILNSNTGTINVSGEIYKGLGGYSYAIYNQNNGKVIINGIESTENGGYGDQFPALTYG